MIQVRVSTPEDVPAQRRLWKLAFGDEDAYLDNFYQNYYRPERVLVLEEAGELRAMTAWFATGLVLPDGSRLRTAYLYAVSTHPDFRGRGLAGQLLAGADRWFRRWDIPAVTTVPAEPSLHRFFGANGFRECFVHDPRHWEGQGANPLGLTLRPLPPGEYAQAREARLAGTVHIFLPREAAAYQEGASRLSGGGLYALSTPGAETLLCTEGLPDGRLLVKELLGPEESRAAALSALPLLLPNWSGDYRIPGETVPFGMLKWLDSERERAWNWKTKGYLGLAFD